MPVRAAMTRAFARELDRRAGPLMRRGGRGAGGKGWGDGDVATDQLLYALRGFSAANGYQTASGGGEPGATSGFGVVTILAVEALAGIAVRSTNRSPASGGTGYLLYVDASNKITFGVGNNSLVLAPTYQLTASDVGRQLVVIGWYDGAKVRLMVSRVQVGDGSAVSGSYVPYSAPTSLSGVAGAPATNPATNLRWSGGLTFTGTPSEAQLQALTDTIRSSGDVPLTFTGGTVTHRASLKEQLAKAGVAVVDGQTGPAQLDDTVTAASVDALVRAGAPTVKVTDPSIDGRASYGVMGYGAAAGLSCAAGKGIRGSDLGWYGVWLGSWSGPPAATAALMATSNNGGDGWQLFCTSAGALTLNIRSNSVTYAITAAGAVAAATAGSHVISIGYIASNTTAYLLVDGVSVGSVSVPSGLNVTSFGFAVGNRGDLAIPGTTFAWFGSVGADAVTLTLAELQTNAAAIMAAGRVLALDTRSQHLWDPTQDTIANGGPDNGAPLQVLDRIGTDHLTQSIAAETSFGSGKALKLSATEVCGTKIGGGILGAASAVTVSMLMSPLTAIAGTGGGHWFASQGNGSLQGWVFGRLGAQGANGSLSVRVASVGIGSYAIQNADLGTLKLVSFTYDGTTARFYVDGVLVSSGAVASLSMSAYALLIGMQSADPLTPSNDTAFVGLGGGAYVASAAELAAQAAASKIAGALVAIPGKTDQRRYNYPVAAASKPLPASVADDMGNVDPLVRSGLASLQVAQRVERIYANEATPTMKAGRASTGNRWEGVASVAAGGDAAGFFVGLLARTKSSTTGRMVANSAGGTQGWSAFCVSGNQWQFSAVDGSGVSKTAGVIFLTAASENKVRTAMWVWDAPMGLLRAYSQRAQVGSGVGMTSYNLTGLSAMGLSVGALYGGGAPGPDTDEFGFVYGVGVPSLAQYQAWEDACMAGEDIASIVGATHRYSFKSGLQGTTLKDLIGSYDLPVVGAPTVVDYYDRAFSR